MDLAPNESHVLHQWKHGRPMIACAYDPQHRFLFSSSEDYTLQRWNLESGEKVSWEAHDSWVRDLAFIDNGQTLVSAGCDDRISLWTTDADKPTAKAEIVAHKGWVRCLDVSPDGQQFASGGNDQLVKLWSSDGKLIREFQGHDSHVYSVFFHPDGQLLLSGDLSGKVHQWELSSGKLLRTFDGKSLHTYNGGQRVHYGGVRGLALSSDGKLLAACGLHKATNPLGAVNEPLVLLFDWEKGEQVRAQPADGVRGIGWQIEFLEGDIELCAAGGAGGGFLLFWKTGEEKPFHKLKLPDTARDMSLHPDGIHIATTHYDGHVRVSRMAKKSA